jgi:hypothetical protein
MLDTTATVMRFEGTDVFEFDDGRLRRLRRSFDEMAVADAPRLQTIVVAGKRKRTPTAGESSTTSSRRSTGRRARRSRCRTAPSAPPRGSSSASTPGATAAWPRHFASTT